MKATSEQMAGGLLAIVTGALACLSPAHSDTWWLLRAGKDLVTTGQIPLTDTYSYTVAGLPWPNHEWLTEVLFYAAYSAAGMPGLAGLAAGLILVAALLSWRLSEGPFELRFLVFGAALIASAHAFALRPLIVTLAMFSVSCVLIRFDKVWWLPLLILLWVNFHGGAVFGVLAVFALGASDLLSGQLHGAKAAIRLGGMATLSLAATFLSPLGSTFWTFIPESATRSANNQLLEWASPGLSAQFLPFWLTAAALVVLTVRGWRRIDYRQRRLVAVALGVLPLAVSSMRTVPIFFLVAIPAVTILASARRVPARDTRTPSSHRRSENLRLNGAIRMAFAAAAALGVTLVWRNPPDALRWHPVRPEAATAIAACDSPIYNTYNNGGELIWFVPQQKVFIDNRHDPYPTELLNAARTLETDGDFRPLFDRYGIRCAAVPPDSVVGRSLHQAGWSVQYQDGQWLILTSQRPK